MRGASLMFTDSEGLYAQRLNTNLEPVYRDLTTWLYSGLVENARNPQALVLWALNEAAASLATKFICDLEQVVTNSLGKPKPLPFKIHIRCGRAINRGQVSIIFMQTCNTIADLHKYDMLVKNSQG